MGHFHKLDNGEHISQKKITASGDSITVGFWGYVGFNGTELTVTSNTAGVNPIKGKIIGNSREWTIKGRVSAQAMISALYTDEFGTHTWDWFEVLFGAAAPVPAGGHKYTSNPNEVVTRTTIPTAFDVVTLLQAWAQLTNNGARTLTAQFMHETGGGKYCFNWNLGNVKEITGNAPHMYLRNVWEVYGPEQAQALVAQANGLGHVATSEEITQHGWSCPAGKAVAVFQPPHPICRFRAYASLAEGAQRWLNNHKSYAQRVPNYVTSLNAGDIAAVARVLKNVGYYTGGEADYTRGMTRFKAEIDRTLGAHP